MHLQDQSHSLQFRIFAYVSNLTDKIPEIVLLAGFDLLFHRSNTMHFGRVAPACQQLQLYQTFTACKP